MLLMSDGSIAQGFELDFEAKNQRVCTSRGEMGGGDSSSMSN